MDQMNGPMDQMNGPMNEPNEWTDGMDRWTKRMDRWNGPNEWTDGMDQMNGPMEWTDGPNEWTDGMDRWTKTDDDPARRARNASDYARRIRRICCVCWLGVGGPVVQAELVLLTRGFERRNYGFNQMKRFFHRKRFQMRPFSSLAFDAANFWGERSFSVWRCEFTTFPLLWALLLLKSGRTFDLAHVDRPTFGLAKLDFRASRRASKARGLSH